MRNLIILLFFSSSILAQDANTLFEQASVSYEHKEYAQAEAIARLWEGASPREEAFKSVGLSKERMMKLFRAQAASELECF